MKAKGQIGDSCCQRPTGRTLTWSIHDSNIADTKGVVGPLNGVVHHLGSIEACLYCVSRLL